MTMYGALTLLCLFPFMLLFLIKVGPVASFLMAGIMAANGTAVILITLGVDKGPTLLFSLLMIPVAWVTVQRFVGYLLSRAKEEVEFRPFFSIFLAVLAGAIICVGPFAMGIEAIDIVFELSSGTPEYTMLGLSIWAWLLGGFLSMVGLGTFFEARERAGG